MGPLINQAIYMGYTAANIISFLSNKIPGLGNGVKSAKSQGYGDEDILKFLKNKIPSTNKKANEDYSNHLERYMSSSGLKSKAEKEETRNKFIKGALRTAGTALGAYQLYKNYSGIMSQLTGSTARQTPTMPNSPMPNQSTNPQAGFTPGQQIKQDLALPGQNQNATPTTPQPLPQSLAQTPQIDSESIIKQLGFEDFIKDLVKRGNMSEGVAGALHVNMTPEQKKWLKSQTEMPIAEIVKDYLGKTETQEPQIPDQIQAPEAIQQSEITQPIEKIQTPPEEIKPVQESKTQIAKGSTVITPEGDITEIEALPGKTAKVRIDGKSKIYDPEDLTPEPENKDEILEIYENLISKIPEEAKSSVLNWVGYDPERNLLQVKFHNGKSYTYENIPTEFADKLKDAEFLAKTSGNNYYGAWETGESSRGAGIYQLIKELQKAYGGKGNEYSGKFSEIYSFFGIPEQKLREKLERERQEKKKKRKGNP